MKKLIVVFVCIGLFALTYACTGISKEDSEAQLSELQKMKEVQSGILAVLDMTEEEVIGYKNGTWDFPEPIIEPATEAPATEVAEPATEAAEVELSSDGVPVTIELTVDNFTDYFAFALTPEYDAFGEVANKEGGTVRIRSINELYKGYLPIFSDNFAVKAKIDRDTIVLQTNSVAFISGKTGLLEAKNIDNVIGSVTFFPIGTYELQVSGLKTNSPQYSCFIRQYGNTSWVWPSYCFDLAFFMEENGIEEVEAQP